jgi:hypothetical protein
MHAHWRWQRHHHDKGNNAIATMAERLGIDGNNTITTRATTPAHGKMPHSCAEIRVICLFVEKKAPTTVMLALQNQSFMLVRTLILGQIGFLSQTASSQRRVELPSLLDGERATMRSGSGHKPYLVFLRTSLYFELCPIKIIFFWREMSI